MSVEDAISLDRAVRFRENAGGQLGNNRRSYGDISMTARKKPARLKHVCLALDRMPKMRREDETRGWRFPGKTGLDVCLGRVGVADHTTSSNVRRSTKETNDAMSAVANQSLHVCRRAVFGTILSLDANHTVGCGEHDRSLYQ